MRRRRLPMGHRLVRRSCFWQLWFATVPQSELKIRSFFEGQKVGLFFVHWKRGPKAWSVVYVSAILLYVCSKEMDQMLIWSENLQLSAMWKPRRIAVAHAQHAHQTNGWGLDWQRKSSDLTNEKSPGCLGYIGDYTTQLYGDYYSKTIMTIPMKQPFFSWLIWDARLFVLLLTLSLAISLAIKAVRKIVRFLKCHQHLQYVCGGLASSKCSSETFSFRHCKLTLQGAKLGVERWTLKLRPILNFGNLGGLCRQPCSRRRRRW